MFGVSFLEIAVIGLVALVIVGPQKLPAMMRTAGEWIGKLRRMTSDVRAQTGIDDILREEGIDGVGELRTLLRGQYNLRNVGGTKRSAHWSEPTPQPPDLTVEFPVEGADSASALPDDLVFDGSAPDNSSNSATPTAADPTPKSDAVAPSVADEPDESTSTDGAAPKTAP